MWLILLTDTFFEALYLSDLNFQKVSANSNERFLPSQTHSHIGL